MNKKMAANTYLSTNESKNKQTNKQKKTHNTENILMVASWDRNWGDG